MNAPHHNYTTPTPNISMASYRDRDGRPTYFATCLTCSWASPLYSSEDWARTSGDAHRCNSIPGRLDPGGESDE